MNSHVLMRLRPDGEEFTRTDIGGSTRKPCQHLHTVCAACIDSWSLDYDVKITPGVIRTFVRRFGQFPFHLLLQGNTYHLIVPEVHQDEVRHMMPTDADGFIGWSDADRATTYGNLLR